MSEPTKPADAAKRLFADSPVHVQKLASQARKELRAKKRADFMRQRNADAPYRQD